MVLPLTAQTIDALELVTRLGETPLIAPATAAVAIALTRGGSWRAARALLATMLACALMLAIVKVAFMTCATSAAGSRFIYSPSGHTGMASAFYGSIYILAGGEKPGFGAQALRIICPLVVAVVAISRVLLDAHTIAEVVFGLVLGAACIAVFLRPEEETRVEIRALAAALAIAAGLAAVADAAEFAPEPMVQKLSRWLDLSWMCKP